MVGRFVEKICIAMAFLLKCVCYFLGISLLAVTAAFANCVEDSKVFEEPKEARTEEVKKGADITFKCILADSKDVGTDCQWNYGPEAKVVPVYPDTDTKKYHFVNYSEQNKNCTITIHNVTERDESDWKCTYMHGTQGQQVCAKPITLKLKNEATEDPSSPEEPMETTTKKMKETTDEGFPWYAGLLIGVAVVALVVVAVIFFRKKQRARRY